jgi:hypothetical protein
MVGEGPQVSVERFEFGVDGVVEPQEPVDGAPGVFGKLQIAHPGQAFGREESPVGQDHQQPSEDAVDAILEPSSVSHQRRTNAGQVPQPLGDAVRLPHLGEEVAPE